MSLSSAHKQTSARRSRHFGPLRLWMAAQVLRAAQDEETGARRGTQGGGPVASAGGQAAPSSVQKPSVAQKTQSAASQTATAKPRAVHTPKLNLDAAPHPTDAFMKGDGI